MNLSHKMMGSLLPTDGDNFASLLDNLLWNIPFPLGFVDTSLRFLRVNEVMADLVEIEAEACPGIPFAEVVTGLDDSVYRVLEGVVATHETIMNLEVERIDPQARLDASATTAYWQLNFYPIVGSGGELLAIGIVVVDTTDRRRGREERLRLLAAEQEARRLAEEAVGRLGFLQELTVCLSDTRTIEDVAQVVRERLRTRYGLDHGNLLLLSDKGFISAGSNDDDQLLGFNDPIALGDTGVMRRLQAEAARTGALTVDHLEADGQTVAAVPLTSKGVVLGLLTLQWTDHHTIGSGEHDLLLAIGEQCVQALERARLHLGELEARERLALLAEASRVLATSLDEEATLSAVAQLVVPEVADVCLAYVQRDEGLLLVGAAHVDPAQMHMLATRVRSRETHPLDDLEQVARTGEPLVYLGTAPTGDGITIDRRASPRLAVPLRMNDRNLGVLSLSMAQSGRTFRSTDLAWVGDFAARVAGAIDNARLYRERATIAHTLQRSLLPPSLPIIPGFEIAARYHPVGDGSLVGGDFYDVFALSETGWGIVMGDASGKGVDAASLTSLSRHTVRVAGRRESSPSKVLEVLNQAILEADLDERFCTIAHAWVEVGLDSAKVRLSLGGHPSPLLVRADGSMMPIGRSGTAIGLFPDPELVDDEVELFPGDMLVLYTDGLTEARSPQGAWGEGLLEAAIEEHKGLDATRTAVVIEQSVLRFEEDNPRDDIGLLVLRMPYPDQAVTGSGMTKRLYAEPTAVAIARHQISEWIVEQDFDDISRDDVVLVVSELVTNAVRVARSHVDVRAWSTIESVVVEVVDDGDGFADFAMPTQRPDLDVEDGRGLFIVEALSSHCEITPGSWGTMVRATFNRS